MSAFDLAVQRNDTALLAAVTRMEAELAKEHLQADRLECIEALNEYLQRYPPGSQYALSGPPERVYLKVVARSMPLTELQHLLPPKEYPPLPERSSKYLLWWDKPMLKAWMLVRDDRGVDAVTKELLAVTEPSPERPEMQTHIKFHLPAAAAETARAMIQVADLLRSGTLFEASSYVAADLILPLRNAQTVFNRPFVCETTLPWPDFVEKSLLNLPDAREVFSREASVLVTLANGVVLRSLAPGIPTKASLDSFEARLRAADVDLGTRYGARLVFATTALSALAGDYLAGEPEVARAKERVRRELAAFTGAVTESLRTRSGPPLATSLSDALQELQEAQENAEERLRRVQEARRQRAASEQEALRKERERQEEAAREERAEAAQRKNSYRWTQLQPKESPAAAPAASSFFTDHADQLAQLLKSVLEKIVTWEEAQDVIRELQSGPLDTLKQRLIDAIERTKVPLSSPPDAKASTLFVAWLDFILRLEENANPSAGLSAIETILSITVNRPIETQVQETSLAVARRDTVAAAGTLYNSLKPRWEDETCAFNSLMAGLFWKRGGYFSRLVRSAKVVYNGKSSCDANALHAAVLDDAALMERLPRVDRLNNVCKTARLWYQCMNSVSQRGDTGDPNEFFAEFMEFYNRSDAKVLARGDLVLDSYGPQTMVVVETYAAGEKEKTVPLERTLDGRTFKLWSAMGTNGGHYEALVQDEDGGWVRVDPSLRKVVEKREVQNDALQVNDALQMVDLNWVRMAIYVKPRTLRTIEVIDNGNLWLDPAAWPYEMDEIGKLQSPDTQSVEVTIIYTYSKIDEMQLVRNMFIREEENGKKYAVLPKSLKDAWLNSQEGKVLSLFALDQFLIAALDPTRADAAVEKIRHALIAFDLEEWETIIGFF